MKRHLVKVVTAAVAAFIMVSVLASCSSGPGSYTVRDRRDPCAPDERLVCVDGTASRIPKSTEDDRRCACERDSRLPR